MVENIPQTHIDLENIPENLSYEAMETKYIFDLNNKKLIIGEGGFGKVYQFINKNDQHEYAAKHMQCMDPEDFTKLLNEKVY